jgi:hypothetical protein
MKKSKKQPRLIAFAFAFVFCWAAIGTGLMWYELHLHARHAAKPVAADPCFPMKDQTGVHTFCGSPDYPFNRVQPINPN